MASRLVALGLCFLLVASSIPVSAGIVRSGSSNEGIQETTDPEALPIVLPSENPEQFRIQLIDFLHDMDDALVIALAHPAIGPRLAEQVGQRGVTIPLPADVYQVIENASWDDLDTMRDGLMAAPGAFATPAMLRDAVTLLPAPDDPAFAVATDAHASCSDVYTEFSRTVSLTEAQRGVTIARNVTGLLTAIYGLIVASFNATVTTCETPIDFPTSWSQIPAIVILGIAEIVDLALALTLDELGFSIVDADRCINLTTCPPHGFTERFRPDEAPGLAGKGCDDRDNNCANGIDEIAEDRFAPEVSIDAALASRCYADPQLAEATARLAVRAFDDCAALSENPVAYEGQLDVTFTRAGCFGALSATATDKNGNIGAASAAVTIDDAAPVIALQDLGGTCQPDVESARQAFGFVPTDQCTAVRSDVRVVEKECVADFEFEAEDACGNRATETRSVRLDSAAPSVDIERLLLPSFENRLCFASEAGAVDEIAEATAIDDNCTAAADLAFTTSAIPTGQNACDLQVTSTAVDTCSLTTSDSVVARVDITPPVVTCAVTEPVLWPADQTMQDVGFSMAVTDDCGMQDVTVAVKVTSDEATAQNLPVKGGDDPSPDARVIVDGMGDIDRILLRAERRQTQSADGRVYRIRVTATDGCGNSSQADCFVSVPKSLSGTNSELVNSGQNFDATAVN